MNVHSIETGACEIRGTLTRSDGASVSPASFGSSTPFGNAIEVIRISCAQRERHEVDDELLVGANVGAGILGFTRSLAADTDANGRGVAAKDVEERKRRGVDGAAWVPGRDPRNGPWQHGCQQQFVSLHRRHLFEVELHAGIPALVDRPNLGRYYWAINVQSVRYKNTNGL